MTEELVKIRSFVPYKKTVFEDHYKLQLHTSQDLTHDYFIDDIINDFELAGFILFNDPLNTHTVSEEIETWTYEFYLIEPDSEVRVIVDVQTVNFIDADFDIIVDDLHFESYLAAQYYMHDQLVELIHQYQEWKQEDTQ